MKKLLFNKNLIVLFLTFSLVFSLSSRSYTQCQAGFTFVVSNDTVYFTNTSTGYTIPNYYWNFGDGTYSNTLNPIHQYSQTGSYVVCLTAIDSIAGCSNTFCDTVIATSVACHAGFTAYTGINLTVYFNDISWGQPIAWFWDFGDGNTSTIQNPTHTYSDMGNYWVCLVVTTFSDTCTFCDTVIVTACNANFTYYDSTAQNIVFTDLTNNNPVAWYWDFGDGSNSTLQNPSHQYINQGNFTVCLTSFTSPGDSCTYCHNVCICSPCQASFTYVVNGNTVTFTNTSSCLFGNPTNYYWSFGDFTSSNTQNPTHTYGNGVYQIYLMVWDSTSMCGQWCDTSGSITTTIIAVNACNAMYSYTAGVPYSITFNDQSFGNISGWSWDFGDGTSSTLQNPVHLYPGSGVYFACLNAYTTWDSCSWCDSVYVGCISRFNWYADTSGNGNVYFTDHSFSNPIGWYWDFGDGSNSSQQNPFHNYALSGTYYVCLTTYTQYDTCTTCDSVIVFRLTGVNDVFLTNETVLIFPNPANNEINIFYPNNENLIEWIRIIDILGRQKYYSAYAVTFIKTSFLEQGVYFIEIKEKDPLPSVLKFFISR